MKLRMLLALAMLLVLLMASSVPAAAGGATVPFKAFYSMHPQVVGTVDGCNVQELPGEGQATHLGNSTWYSDAVACIDPETRKGVQYGTSIFTAADGAKLIGTFSGVAEIRMTAIGPEAVFSGTYWVTEGRGRLDGYTGTGDYWGTALLVQGTGELYFDGTLTKPQKP